MERMSGLYDDVARRRDAAIAELDYLVDGQESEWAEEAADALLMWSAKYPESQLDKHRNELKDLLSTIEEKVRENYAALFGASLAAAALGMVQGAVGALSGLLGLPFTEKYVPFAERLSKDLTSGRWYGSRAKSLDSALRRNGRTILRDLWAIVDGCLSRNESPFDIARKIRWFLVGNQISNWDVRDRNGNRIYPRNVGYLYRRLFHTMMQHCYEGSVRIAGDANPFVSGYYWVAAGPNPCELCQDRDGNFYKPSELPVDHPNGRCTVDPVLAKDWRDKLIDWGNSPRGTYPEIDDWFGE